MDEQKLTGTKDIDIFYTNCGRWHIRDYGRGLKYEHLTQNENEEKIKNPNLIGKFGVGLKDALATLDRNNIKVIIRSKYGDITFAKVPKIGFNDIITLHAQISSPLDDNFIGTEFIFEGITVEHDVGAFSLDILAKDASNGNIIAIENQLEITDHNHLGQILTYASGVDAKTIIWISKEVREEHRKAIDWLNQITNEEVEFFAVEIQLIRISNSDPAPFFKIKASPNDWSKEQKTKISTNAGLSERSEYFHKFFSTFMEFVYKELPGLTNSRKINYDAWKSFPTGYSGYTYMRLSGLEIDFLLSCI